MTIKYRGQTFSGYNKPKAQVSGGKSHVVLAKKGNKVKLVRFGQAGKKGSPKGTKRNQAFHARHNCSAKKDKFTAGYWACKHKWQERMAKKQKPIWDKPRPKGLGKSKKLTPAQKAKAKARAKANGRKYPNMVDNMWAASRQDHTKVSCPKCGQHLLVKNSKLYCTNPQCKDYTKVK